MIFIVIMDTGIDTWIMALKPMYQRIEINLTCLLSPNRRFIYTRKIGGLKTAKIQIKTEKIQKMLSKGLLEVFQQNCAIRLI